jgi:hypothetical protein
LGVLRVLHGQVQRLSIIAHRGADHHQHAAHMSGPKDPKQTCRPAPKCASHRAFLDKMIQTLSLQASSEPRNDEGILKLS